MHKALINKVLRRSPKSLLFDLGMAVFLWIVMVRLEIATVTTISPLASMLCFGFFAYRMSPKWVCLWVGIFSTTSLFFLFQDPFAAESLMTVYIRFGTLVVGGMGAIVLSTDRTRITESFLQTIEILEKLPAPVIISDCSGCIVFMNNDALELLDIEADQVQGASYFSFLSAEEKGRMIQRYFDFVDSKQTTLHNMALHLKKPVPIKTQATLVAIDGEFTKLLATVLWLPPSNGIEKKAREKA